MNFKNTLSKFNIGILPIFVFAFISIVIFTISRLGLLLWHQEGTDGNIAHIFLYGLRYDVSILCSLLSLVFLVSILGDIFNIKSHVIILFKKIYLSLVTTIVLLLELSTPPFIIEYGVRPNHIYVEYLIYPKEVISTIANGHIIESIVCILLCIVAFILLYKLANFLYSNYKSQSRISAFVTLVILLIALPLGIRGTIGHKPLNPSNAAFGSIPLANDLPVNSAFTVFYALRHLGADDVKGSEIYAFDNVVNVLNNLNTFSKRTLPNKIDDKCPINQVITPSITPNQKRNVVVILMESYGARYVKSLGGDPVSPNLDALKEEGWWFERMYATGHRSVRGIEAVSASYPSSPLTAQVKLSHSKPITTLPEIYEKLGYNTSFIYGGESHFDNMRTYFLDNGVQDIIEQKDYKKPSFVASWGVSDEDLFNKANENFVKLDKENKPFFSLVFTSSFHDPFDIPDGKVNIDGIQTDDPKRLTAAKYADFALGEFFKKAKSEDYYKNTIFLVIADHDSRVRGIGAFPLTNYSIPALILSPDIKPRKDNRIVSQIDMLPTLLSLSGVSGQIPVVGQDLTRDDIYQRAVIAYNELFGFVENDNFTLLIPPHNASKFKIGEHNSLHDMRTNLSDDELKREISYLNLGINIFKYNMNDADCIKDLKQN